MVREIFACALVNGSGVLRCPLRVQGATGGEIPLAPEDVVVTAEGGTELHVIFYSPGVVPASGRHWEGVLSLDGGRADLPLGAIRTRRQRCEVRLVVPFVPARAALRVIAVASAPTGPEVPREEAELLDRVVEAMEDPTINPRCGSLPISDVCTAITKFAGPGGIVEAAYGGDIEAFLRAHPQTFTLFQYTGSEIKGRGMEDYVKPWDTRVVLKKGKRVQFCEAEEEEEALAFMREVLKGRDLTSDELLSAIHAEGKGLAISPAFSQLMRFLGRNKHIFSWSTDPSQVTVVGLAPAAHAKQRQQNRFAGWGTPAVIRPCAG